MYEVLAADSLGGRRSAPHLLRSISFVNKVCQLKKHELLRESEGATRGVKPRKMYFPRVHRSRFFPLLIRSITRCERILW